MDKAVENSAAPDHKIAGSAKIQGFPCRGFADNHPPGFPAEIMKTLFVNPRGGNINLCKHVFHNLIAKLSTKYYVTLSDFVDNQFHFWYNTCIEKSSPDLSAAVDPGGYFFPSKTEKRSVSWTSHLSKKSSRNGIPSLII